MTLEGRRSLAYRERGGLGELHGHATCRIRTGQPRPDLAKLARLADIVEEAPSNGRKVVVFSFFRNVLQAVTALLDGVALGPFTGSVPPGKRQGLVDEFTTRQGPRVLVSQIQAGGVGLNIQAASVVIITEPQWKPTIEEQAIARCHRMGQVRPSTCTGCSPRTASTSGCSTSWPPKPSSSTNTSAAANSKRPPLIQSTSPT